MSIGRLKEKKNISHLHIHSADLTLVTGSSIGKASEVAVDDDYSLLVMLAPSCSCSCCCCCMGDGLVGVLRRSLGLWVVLLRVGRGRRGVGRPVRGRGTGRLRRRNCIGQRRIIVTVSYISTNIPMRRTIPSSFSSSSSFCLPLIFPELHEAE